MKSIILFLFLLLIPIASSSFVINNGSSVTSTTLVQINITQGETYTFTVDNRTMELDNSTTSLELDGIKGYHNVTINDSLNITYITLIYDTDNPEIIISNFTSKSYYYSQLPIPSVTTIDDNSIVFITKTLVNSSAGAHTFTVTATDIANRYSTKSINYTVITNTTVNLTKDSTLLLPLMTSNLSFKSNNPVNLSILFPVGFTTSPTSYTNITSLNFTIKAGISPLDSFVTVSVSYADSYGTSSTIPLQYWLVGNKTVFYITYDSDKNAYISRQEAMNATKIYYTTTSILSDRIKEMIRIYRNNQSYIK